MADVPLLVNPMTSVGDLIVGGASGAAGRLGAGTEGQVLKVGSGGVLEWDDESGAGGGSSLLAIGDPPSFAGTADKDFRGAANLGGYAVTGATAAGTIALRETSTTVDKYQLTDAGLLIQAGHAVSPNFECTYTLPDLQSMVMFGAFAPRFEAGDNAGIGLRLRGPSATEITIMLEQDSAEYVVQGNSSIDAAGFEFTTPQLYTPPIVGFRICRDGLAYRSYVSMNGGLTWHYVDTDTFAAALTTVAFWIKGASASQTRMPAGRILFIVEGAGDDSYDPW